MVSRKRKCGLAYLAAILLLPPLSWTLTTGGYPICCWGMSCAMSCPTSCPMRGHCGATPACCAQAHVVLTLPTPLIPVVPMPPAPRIALAALPGDALPPAPTRALAGWPAAVFHPPTA